jgi:hypothetical protein
MQVSDYYKSALAAAHGLDYPSASYFSQVSWSHCT